MEVEGSEGTDSDSSSTLDVVHISIQNTQAGDEADAGTLQHLIQQHRSVMQDVAEAQGHSPKSLVLSVAKYEAITHHLQQPHLKVEPHFKHWVKTRRFRLLDLPGREEKVLVMARDRTDRWGYKSSFLRVVHAGQLSDLVYKIHAEELHHSGYKRVLERLQRRYFGVTRVYVQEFCKTCPVCKLKPHQSAALDALGQPAPPEARQQAVARAERRGSFQEVAGLDLIDMRQTPDGEYRFIGHFLDQYSRFHVLFPLKRRAAPELSRLLEERVLGYFGPPRVIQVGEGVEVLNRLVSSTLDRWADQPTLLDRHSKTSQAGRAMERCRQAVLQQLADIREGEGEGEGGRYPWASWLPRVMFTLNSQCRDSAKDSPYFSVYGCSSPVLLYSEGRCQGREQPLDSDGEEVLESGWPGGAGWGQEAGRGGHGQDEEPASLLEAAFDAQHSQDPDHNYINTNTNTTKKLKLEMPDYDD